MSDALWKERALEDFRRWLDEAPAALDEAIDDPVDPPTDLRALFAELAALRQEVKLTSREQSRAARELHRATENQEALVAILTRHDERAAAVGAAASERAHERGVEAERATLLMLLGVHDALVRGRAASVAVAEHRAGFLTRAPPGIDGVRRGYEFALERLHHALEALGVERIATIGKLFDPAHMNAVDVRDVASVRQEIVLEEHVSGFLHDDGVLRLAEVVVGRPMNTSSHGAESSGTRSTP